MTMPHTAAGFQTTSWTLVLRAPSNGRDLGKLLNQYRWPLYAFLRRKGYSEHDAEDWTQDFICKLLLERDVLTKADQSRGRFRSFLLKSLENHIKDERRRISGRDPKTPRPTVIVSDDPYLHRSAEPCCDDDPYVAFDRQWATTVLNLVLARVENDCASSGMSRQWTAFEERIIRPAKLGCEPTPIEELIQRLGAQTAQQIYSMLQTVQRKIAATTRAVVAETVDNPADIDAELALVREYLTR